MKLDAILAIYIILPTLLIIVLGFAYFARKAKKVQITSIKDNLVILNEVLGHNVTYVDQGKLPFSIVGEDPSLHANYANSCLCSNMIKVRYNKFDYAIVNMETIQSRGYGVIDYSIFSGSYIFLSSGIKQSVPLYACDNLFWKDFNVKDSMTFKVNDQEISEVPFLQNFKLLISKDHWNSTTIGIYTDILTMLQPFFMENEHKTSIYIYSDGSIGLAIRDYKLFDFSQGKLPDFTYSDSASSDVREKILKDAKLIKSYLELIRSITKSLLKY